MTQLLLNVYLNMMYTCNTEQIKFNKQSFEKLCIKPIANI